MAQVLAPIVQTSGSMTMLHSSSDAFQSPSASQPHPQQPRTSQMSRPSVYNGQSGGAGYRGTSSAPIAPYAFSSTPQLRQENRTPSALTQQFSAGARLGHPSHPSSSSDSTVSTSGSSSRSMIAPHLSSKDDSVLGSLEHKRDTSASTITLSTSVPDLSLSLQDTPVKPSPSRYRTGARRTDSNNTITAVSTTATPTQLSPSQGGPPSIAAPKIDASPILTLDDLQAPTRPGHNRASSVDDLHMPRQGSVDQAKRYRRRSLSGLDAAAQAGSGASPTPTNTSTVTPIKRSTQELRPTSSSSRQGSRPNSSQSHERQGSAGSASSSISRPPVRIPSEIGHL